MARVTANHKRVNDEHAARLARSASIVPISSRELDEQAENARIELLTLCDMGKHQDENEVDVELRLRFYEGFREVVREFCTALGAHGATRRNNHLEQMHAAIESLERYRGVGR